MAAPKKRREFEVDKPPPPDDEEDADDIDDEDEADVADEADMDSDNIIDLEIPLDFDARTATDADFHGIKRLLQQLFLKASVDLGAIANIILGQNHVGSVIKHFDDDEMDEEGDEEEKDSEEDVFGITTVINVTQRLSRRDDSKDKPISEGAAAIKQVQDYLINHCQRISEPSLAETLRAYFCDPNDPSLRTGWLINERFVNIPPHISIPLHDSLRDELHSACAKGQSFDFSHFLIISKVLVPKDSKNEPMIFANGEEELFYEESCFNFKYAVVDEMPDAEDLSDKSDDNASYEPWRVVMIIQAEKIPVVAEKMEKIMGASIVGKVVNLKDS